MRAIRWTLAGLGLALLAAGCVKRSSSPVEAKPADGSGPMLQGAKPGPGLPDGVTPDMVTRGNTLFNNGSCVRCHGLNGVGGPRAPSLTDNEWIHISRSYPAIVDLVTRGFTKAEQRDPRYQFTMNPRGGTSLSDAEIRAVAAYVWSISAP